MQNSDIAALIERVEKADGPDLLLDALIEIEARRQTAYAAGLNDQTRAKWQPVGSSGEVESGGTRYHSPEYTRSIDAAVALIERVLPGWVHGYSGIQPGLMSDKDKPFIADLGGPVTLVTYDSFPEPTCEAFGGSGATPALALLHALLRALQSQEPSR